MNMDLDARRLLLQEAGLDVVDQAWSGALPGPMSAWKRVIGGDVRPTGVVRTSDRVDFRSDVESKWERLARRAGILGGSGGFLISIAGVGAVEAPWALVRETAQLDLAGKLSVGRESPEFVAMSLDGESVCGVTGEEDEIWIVLRSLK